MKKLSQTMERHPRIKRCMEAFQGFFEKSSTDHVSAFSAQAAFFMLLSIFPMLMIVLNLARYMPFTQQDVISLIANIMPNEFVQFLNSIIMDLYSKSKMPLLSLSVLLTLWSAAKGMQAIANGLDSVYDCEVYRGFVILRLKAILYTLVFIILIVVTLCLFVFGNTIYHNLVNWLPHLENIAGLVIGIRTVVGVVTLFLFFLLLYTTLPNHGKRNSGGAVRAQVYGALFSSSAWILLSYAFSFYIDNFSSFSYMYGSLTTVMLAMLWLYFCMYIIFIGAEINVFLHRGRSK